MQALRFFISTHDRTKQTFPAQLTQEDFAGFYASYEAACYEEGVIPLRTHVGYDDGRAFCFDIGAECRGGAAGPCESRSAVRFDYRSDHCNARRHVLQTTKLRESAPCISWTNCNVSSLFAS